MRMFVGTFARKGLPGLYRCELDPRTLAVTRTAAADGLTGATYLAVNRQRTRLYTFDLSDDIRRPHTCDLVVFDIGGGAWTETGRVRIAAVSPCHIALAPDERAVVWAGYRNGTFGFVRLGARGDLDGTGWSGAHSGAGAHPVRQDRAHIHFCGFTPDGKCLGVADLGLDRIAFYDWTARDAAAGLREIDTMRIRARAGAGPRHFVWGADGRHLYVVHELDSSVSAYACDGRRFVETAHVSSLPRGYDGPDSTAAAIRLSPDGRYLLASNRGHDSIAVFKTGPDGSLRPVNVARLNGGPPRDFAFVPGTDDVVVVGQMDDNAAAFYRFGRADGTLTETAPRVALAAPCCFVF